MVELHHEVRLYRAVEQARDVFRRACVPLLETSIEAARKFGADADTVCELATAAEESLAEWRRAQKVLNAPKLERSLQQEAEVQP